MVISTAGDQQQTGPIGAIGSQGVFTKELQKALTDGRVDLAVHSLKDLPTDETPGLALAAVPPRGPCGDVLVCREVQGLKQLPDGAVVGTGSLRRRSQLLHARRRLKVTDIRGNVETRLRKLDEGEFDAIALAEAGLRRLGLADRITQVLPKSIMLPAVGQGALGLQTRADDDATLAALGPLDDAATHAAVTAERALLHALRGGCMAPVGAWGRIDEGGKLLLDAVVVGHDGKIRLAASATATGDMAEQLGMEVAADLIFQGSGDLIAAARGAP